MHLMNNTAEYLHITDLSCTQSHKNIMEGRIVDHEALSYIDCRLLQTAAAALQLAIQQKVVFHIRSRNPHLKGQFCIINKHMHTSNFYR